MLSMVIVFIIELLFGIYPTTGLTNPHVATLISLGGSSYILVKESGQWYRLLTAIFLHGNLAHLLINMYALAIVGGILEPIIGAGWYLALFFLAGISGTFLSMLFNEPHVTSVGASGAIMGIFTVALIIIAKYSSDEARTITIAGWLPAFILSMLPLSPRIDYIGHIGGALGGFLVAILLILLWSPHTMKPRFAVMGWLIGILGVLATIYSFYLVSLNYPAFKQFFLE